MENITRDGRLSWDAIFVMKHENRSHSMALEERKLAIPLVSVPSLAPGGPSTRTNNAALFFSL